MYTLVIADDITGANDIGIMYQNNGLETIVCSSDSIKDLVVGENDVLIKDTNSRFDSPKVAYEKVYNATIAYSKNKPKQYYNKQCSVFRGNIGAEFDAMLDALNEEFAIVVLGFPDNGRTTLHEVHYVYDTPLEESQFKNDPVHPITESNLVHILQKQTKRKVEAIHYEVLEQGVEYLKERIEKYKKQCNYLIIDVRNNGDLKVIAEAVYHEKIICGSSALAKYLSEKHGRVSPEKIKKQQSIVNHKNPFIFTVAGSLTVQTFRQIEYMKEQGYTALELNTKRIFEDQKCKNEMQGIYQQVEEMMKHNSKKMIILHTMNLPNAVEETKKIGQELGLSIPEISTKISNTLAEISQTIVEKYKIRKLIFCGGDTSASLCSKLNINEMRIGEEIEPGLPVCQGMEYPHYTCVLKSGSFGTDEFIERAMKIMSIE